MLWAGTRLAPSTRRAMRSTKSSSKGLMAKSTAPRRRHSARRASESTALTTTTGMAAVSGSWRSWTSWVIPSTASAKLAAVRAYCQTHQRSVLFDEPGEALFDVFGVKTLALRAADLQSVESLADRDTRAPYLRLVLGDGRELALTDAGIAFAPDF